jgi:predicted MFS family arabinose efflux permease
MTPQPSPQPEPIHEGWLIFVMGAIQFINILDFMVVMPLGPDLASDVGIHGSHIGLIGGAYTLSAAVTGIVASLWLDNYARRRVLMVSFAGLIGATALCAAAQGTISLIAARLLAGAFGGPLSATAIAMVADCIPAERRGAALGKVMGGFSIASVVGVPFGLEMARLFGWRAAFLSIALMGVVVMLMALKKLPSSPVVPEYRCPRARATIMLRMAKTPLVLGGWGMMALGMGAGFMVIPNISAHIQWNLGYPREHIGLLYCAGGAVSFFTMRLVGRLVDKYGASKIGWAATAMMAASLLPGFVFYPTHVPVVVLFIAFMVAMSSRNVSGQTLSSRIPEPHERAGYTSAQNAVVHLACSIGAGGASLMLTETPEGGLLGMPQVALLAVGFAVFVPLIMAWVEKQLVKREI